MTTKTVDVHDAQRQLADLLVLAASGTDVILTQGHVPRARLVPIAPPVSRRVPGLHAGSMVPSPDFDQPLPDEFWLGER